MLDLSAHHVILLLRERFALEKETVESLKEKIFQAQKSLDNFSRQHATILNWHKELKDSLSKLKNMLVICEYCDKEGILEDTHLKIRGFCYEYQRIKEKIIVCSEDCLEKEVYRNYRSDDLEWETYDGVSKKLPPPWTK